MASEPEQAPALKLEGSGEKQSEKAESSETKAASSNGAAPPVPISRLTQIANDACTTALAHTTRYEHALTEGWNTAIIKSILQALVSATTTPTHAPQFKFSVNSTIIQHLTPAPAAVAASLRTSSAEPSSAATETTTEDETRPLLPLTGTAEERVGRRGMHSATGAYWNNERDGMWCFKYEGGVAKGMDVVISLIWVAVS
ncbi:MAG: hypothetical protein M1829_003761 [Trizodia sp. TS-e1964]|nr:MAG: hypothetical protein M1829_003761 [Trizodia sp. TS-e1964]